MRLTGNIHDDFATMSAKWHMDWSRCMTKFMVIVFGIDPCAFHIDMPEKVYSVLKELYGLLPKHIIDDIWKKEKEREEASEWKSYYVPADEIVLWRWLVGRFNAKMDLLQGDEQLLEIDSV